MRPKIGMPKLFTDKISPWLIGFPASLKMVIFSPLGWEIVNEVPHRASSKEIDFSINRSASSLLKTSSFFCLNIIIKSPYSFPGSQLPSEWTIYWCLSGVPGSKWTFSVFVSETKRFPLHDLHILLGSLIFSPLPLQSGQWPCY